MQGRPTLLPPDHTTHPIHLSDGQRWCDRWPDHHHMQTTSLRKATWRRSWKRKTDITYLIRNMNDKFDSMWLDRSCTQLWYSKENRIEHFWIFVLFVMISLLTGVYYFSFLECLDVHYGVWPFLFGMQRCVRFGIHILTMPDKKLAMLIDLIRILPHIIRIKRVNSLLWSIQSARQFSNLHIN